MFHISNIIAQQLYEYPLSWTKSLTYKTYPLASCQSWKMKWHGMRMWP